MEIKKKYITSRRRFRIIYSLCVFGILSSLGFATLFFIADVTDLFYIHAGFAFLYFLGAIIAKKGLIEYTRILYILALNFSIGITASFVGQIGSVEYMFMCAIGIPFVIFSFGGEKHKVVIFSCLAGLFWILTTLTNFNLFTDIKLGEDFVLTYVYPIAVFFTAFMVLVLLFSFSQINVKYVSNYYSKRQEAIEAYDAKSRFLSTMSHEIRTPLNAIIGLSHILKENKPRKNQLDNIEALNYSGKILLNLLNNVLDFSKMQSTKIELDNIPTDLYDAFKQIKKIYEPQCKKKGIEFQVHIDKNIPIVMLDIVRFNQVITNLVNNAIKFTDTGKVTLNIKKGVETNGKVNVLTEVIDSGIGIPKNKTKKIWEPFIQASTSTTRIYGGTGLGLPIVKKIIEAMGSTIVLRSKTGKGSRFYFKLSLEVASKEKEEEKTSKLSIAFNGEKVLLAEDNLINIMVAKQILEKAQLQFVSVNDGQKAIEKAKGEHFDIILMDINMPIMDGYEATQEIRKFNSDVPILALSAEVFSEIKDKIESCGMNGFIFKPFTPEDLLNRIQEYLVTK